jgi:hypothetical protein
MVVLIALTALRRNARTGQPIQVDVVSHPTPKISRISWQVIPGQVKVQLTTPALREASWSRSNSSWGTFRFKRRSATLGASSRFDQLSMIASASSRILEPGARLWKDCRRSGSDQQEGPPGTLAVADSAGPIPAADQRHCEPSSCGPRRGYCGYASSFLPDDRVERCRKCVWREKPVS